MDISNFTLLHTISYFILNEIGINVKQTIDQESTLHKMQRRNGRIQNQHNNCKRHVQSETCLCSSL